MRGVGAEVVVEVDPRVAAGPQPLHARRPPGQLPVGVAAAVEDARAVQPDVGEVGGGFVGEREAVGGVGAHQRGRPPARAGAPAPRRRASSDGAPRARGGLARRVRREHAAPRARRGGGRGRGPGVRRRARHAAGRRGNASARSRRNGSCSGSCHRTGAELLAEQQRALREEVGERRPPPAEPQQVRDVAAALYGEAEAGRHLLAPARERRRAQHAVERAVDLDGGEPLSQVRELPRDRQPRRVEGAPPVRVGPAAGADPRGAGARRAHGTGGAAPVPDSVYRARMFEAAAVLAAVALGVGAVEGVGAVRRRRARGDRRSRWTPRRRARGGAAARRGGGGGRDAGPRRAAGGQR